MSRLRAGLGWVYEHFMWRLVGELLGVKEPRPWTFEIRDRSRRHPWRALAVALSVAAAHIVGATWVTIEFGWWGLIPIAWVGFVGYVAGHLYWDTRGPYVPPR